MKDKLNALVNIAWFAFVALLFHMTGLGPDA